MIPQSRWGGGYRLASIGTVKITVNGNITINNWLLLK